MGRHPMGEGVDPNPRFVSEQLVDPAALVMGIDRREPARPVPAPHQGARRRVRACAARRRLAKAYADGKIQPDLVPVATRSAEKGWGLATADEPPRPGTTMEDLAGLKTPFRPHGRVTAGNAAGLNDGATAALARRRATSPRSSAWRPKMRLVVVRLRRASSPRSWASARSRRPRRRCARPG